MSLLSDSRSCFRSATCCRSATSLSVLQEVVGPAVLLFASSAEQPSSSSANEEAAQKQRQKERQALRRSSFLRDHNPASLIRYLRKPTRHEHPCESLTMLGASRHKPASSLLLSPPSPGTLHQGTMSDFILPPPTVLHHRGKIVDLETMSHLSTEQRQCSPHSAVTN